jgi:hypothetical protein
VRERAIDPVELSYFFVDDPSKRLSASTVTPGNELLGADEAIDVECHEETSRAREMPMDLTYGAYLVVVTIADDVLSNGRRTSPETPSGSDVERMALIKSAGISFPARCLAFLIISSL